MLCFLCLVCAWALGALHGCDREPELPTLHAVPAFEGVDQAGASFGASDLSGRVTVANFVFTSCPSVCPMLTTQMRNLQRRLEAESGSDHAVQLLSITVDPEVDTPARLRDYAALHGADTSSWSFVTLGDHAQTLSLVMEGFRVRMGEREPAGVGEGYDIMHASHFVLVDRERRVRGYYSTTDADGMNRLLRDALRLAR